LRGDGCDDVAHALSEGGGVELGSHDLVRTICHDGDTPVTDEGDCLVWLRGFDLRTGMLGFLDPALSFYIDEDEIVRTLPEDGDAFLIAEGGVDFEALQGEDAIPEGADGFASADVKNYALVWRAICGSHT